MSKLLQRLSDAARSGVYRTSRIDEIEDAARGSGLRVTRIDLAGIAGKEGLLALLAARLEFFAEWGRNWDALKDCLADLSWFKSKGHILIFEHSAQLAAKDRAVFGEILAEVAQIWARDGQPFFAVFVDAAAPLPDLYNDRR